MAWVLVVDDDDTVRDLLQRYLARQGFEVQGVADGEQALRVILDVLLPGLDGLQVLRSLRAEGDPYGVLLTARTEEPGGAGRRARAAAGAPGAEGDLPVGVSGACAEPAGHPEGIQGGRTHSAVAAAGVAPTSASGDGLGTRRVGPRAAGMTGILVAIP
ncbi:MAG: hypothetical protein C4303_07985 [candidate division GAL15 bacterium]